MADETDDELPDEYGGAVELPEVAPDVPHCGMDDDEVERTEFRYSTRGPNDYVVSRPTEDFRGPEHAERWASLRFGERYRGRIAEADEFGRYCFVVRKKGC